MTDAMSIYLCLNQLMLGKKVKELPSVAVDFLKENNLVGDYERALNVKRVKLGKFEKIFINLLRAKDYAFNVMESSNQPLTLQRVAAIARENHYSPDTCAHWGIMLVSDVQISMTGEDYVADSILYVTEKTYKTNPDFDAAMKTAFSMYVYGAVNPSPRQMRALEDTLALAVLDGDTTITLQKFTSLLRSFVVTQLSPCDVGNYVLELSDLAIPMRMSKTLCYWTDYTRLSVSIVVPRATSNVTVVLATMPIEQFTAALKSSPNAFVDACARGQRLVFKEKIVQAEEV